jgi:hypothetical protein
MIGIPRIGTTLPIESEIAAHRPRELLLVNGVAILD